MATRLERTGAEPVHPDPGGHSGRGASDPRDPVDGGGDPARLAERIADARLGLLRFYYWATPLFFLADAALGVSVRASFLPRADLRLAYYGLCVVCAVICHRHADAAPVVGMGESALSLLLIALGVLLPIWDAHELVTAGPDAVPFMTGGKLVNVMLSGSMVVVPFHRQRWRLERQVAPARAGGGVG